MSEFTQILESAQRGNPKAADELLPLVYEELRKLAAYKLAQEASNQTLQPTALVHEVWLRLCRDEDQKWDGRGHFFAAAAQAMQHILFDNARRKNAVRHGGDMQRVNLDSLQLAAEADETQLHNIGEALAKLRKTKPKHVEVIKLRFYLGMTNEEAAKAMNVPARTIKRYWEFARAWLFAELQRQQGCEGRMALVPQVSKPAVSPISKSAGRASA